MIQIGWEWRQRSGERLWGCYPVVIARFPVEGGVVESPCVVMRDTISPSYEADIASDFGF